MVRKEEACQGVSVAGGRQGRVEEVKEWKSGRVKSQYADSIRNDAGRGSAI